MSVIRENAEVVGSGSWYQTRKISDFPYCQTTHDFLTECRKLCDFRFSTYQLAVGQKVRVTHVGGERVMRYTGVIRHVQYGEVNQYQNVWHYTGGALWLQQAKQLKRIESWDIDDIEILK